MEKLQQIPLGEITFLPQGCDPVGRLFLRNNSLFRAVRSEYARFYVELFNSKNIQSLFGKGLIETEIAAFAIDGYGLVLAHKRLSFPSHIDEWSFEMLKDASLLWCDLNTALYEKGLMLKDGRPSDILFDGGRPFFVDWGSIVPLGEESRRAYLDFRERFIFSLYLVSAGQAKFSGIWKTDRLFRGDVMRLLLGRIPFVLWVHYLRDDIKHLKLCDAIGTGFYRSLRKTIESVPLPEVKTGWLHYAKARDIDGVSHEPDKNWNVKMLNVNKIFERMRPQTVLDIGCNTGWYSELAASRGASVVAVDTDDSCINKLYSLVREKKLAIHPVLLDIFGPEELSCEFQTRLEADLVLALAVVHHLVFKNYKTLDAIAARLGLLSKKWLIVEFVPESGRPVGYNLEEFMRALRFFFRQIEVLDSSPPPRVLLFCER